MTKKDDKLVEALIKAEIPRNAARCIVHIIDSKGIMSKDLEKKTGLRQPEVSIAMRYLIGRKWIKIKHIKKKGKGRPIHEYTLSLSKSKLISAIEKDQEKKIKDISKNINLLKSLLK